MTPLPPSQCVELDGRRVEYLCQGHGGPVRVLINGSGGPLHGWHLLLPRLAGSGTTLAYNRPGIGRSAAPARPQTASVMVADLLQLLATLQLPPPWVLVAHSFGGLVANLLARTCPAQVAGVVLLEATAPEDVLQLPLHESRLQRALARVSQRLWPLHPHHETLHARASAAELLAAPGFPPLPLTVLTGQRPALTWATPRALLAARALHQQRLAALSPLGRQVPADASGHFPQFSQPDLVARAVLQMPPGGWPAAPLQA
ncbi:alpha/beta fold hydrolase [Aquabacterium sp. OR-4]|uniref:alpha/beta fold hydrolase n=1 Tax=Aquabacterium sp. OR-4 TaxID=2978127 RepID=UPI0021B4CDC6|nr:alpha/beta hydrolase [Aquabacterium sp. OR-4]MDT7833733.1 alpha/beta hydrolase [Aquabacterium sp. OR-4]